MRILTVLTKPEEALASEKKNAAIAKGVVPYAIIGLVIGIPLGAVIALAATLFSTFFHAGAPLLGLGLSAIVVLPLVCLAVIVVASLVGEGILFLFARLLGGRGSFAQQYYLSSLIVFPAAFLGFIGMLLGLIPFLGALASLALSIYAFYLHVLAVKEAHGFSVLRAFAAVILPAAIVFFLVVLLLFAALASLLVGLAK